MVQRRYWRVSNSFLAANVLAAIVGMAELGQAHSPAERPSYGMPSWDQTLPAETRFVVLENFNSEAVMDQNTGFVWERSPEAVLINLNKTIGGQRGWRLPSIVELTSLLDPSNQDSGSMLLASHPFLNNPSGFYWSASADGDPSRAWHLHLSNGHVHMTSKTSVFKAWCVRGGSTAD